MLQRVAKRSRLRWRCLPQRPSKRKSKVNMLRCSVLLCVAVCSKKLSATRLPKSPSKKKNGYINVLCCRVLQCVAVYCSVLQSVAVCCSVLQSVAVCCSVLLQRGGACPALVKTKKAQAV